MKVFRRKYTLSELYVLRKSFFKLLLKPRKIINFFLASFFMRFRAKKCLSLPFHINIEVTGSCNYQCIKCERFSKTYKDDGDVFNSKNMPFKYYRSIIDEIGDMLLALRLWNYGEPLLNEDIFKMIEYAKKKDIIVALSSNLSLLDQNKAYKLVVSGLDYLVISCDGASKETYRLYHGRDYFNRVIDNINFLIRAKKSLRSLTPFIDLQFIVMNENEKEMKDIKKLAYKLGVNKVSLLRLHQERIVSNKNNKLQNDILPKNKKFRLDEDMIKRISFCRMPWESTLIRYSGLVLPCVGDIRQECRMGNIFQNSKYASFKDIWNNNNYCNFRKRVTDNINQINICFDCAQRDNNVKDQIKI